MWKLLLFGGLASAFPTLTLRVQGDLELVRDLVLADAPINATDNAG
jgi:hypothetical protein